MSPFIQPEGFATSKQAKDLLDQIDAVTTRGEPLMDRFFFAGITNAIPESVERQFPPPEDPRQKLEFAYLFAHVYTGTGEPVSSGLAGTLGLSRHEYRGETIMYNASAVYKIMVGAGRHTLEQTIDYQVGPPKPPRIFRSDEAEALAAHQAKLTKEAKEDEEILAARRALGLLATTSAVANDLIAFAKQLNPHLS